VESCPVHVLCSTVCVEAGQTFSIQRMEVLTPQVSSIHGRLTRGRALVRSQSGPPTVNLR